MAKKSARRSGETVHFTYLLFVSNARLLPGGVYPAAIVSWMLRTGPSSFTQSLIQ